MTNAGSISNPSYFDNIRVDHLYIEPGGRFGNGPTASTLRHLAFTPPHANPMECAKAIASSLEPFFGTSLCSEFTTPGSDLQLPAAHGLDIHQLRSSEPFKSLINSMRDKLDLDKSTALGIHSRPRKCL